VAWSFEGLHTTQCIVSYWGIHAEWFSFLWQWPRACRRCGSAGFHRYNQAVGYYGDIQVVDEQCECTYDGRCPRCGLNGLTSISGDGPCIYCWWDYFPGTWNPADYTCHCEAR
jgi:hypothetical protein